MPEDGLVVWPDNYLRKNAIWKDIAHNNLILIGTVHGDPQGYERARALLDSLRPDLVTVEISPFSLRYRQRYGAGWQRQLAQSLALAELPADAARHLAIQRLTAQVALPFEVKAARDYHRRVGVPWRPLDLGFLSRRHLPRYGPELLSPANLKALLTTPDGPLEEYVVAEFRRARLALVQSPRRFLSPGVSETLRRERFIGRRLRQLASKHPRVVHLGGWEHLVDWQDSPGLWRALADLSPGRVLLDEADRALDFSSERN
ncbi:MAG: hypothetical protein WBV23_08065 [Desulfobaccales bacterium]